MAEKSLGAAIDEIIQALSALPENARLTAIRAACDHLGLALPTAAAAPNTHRFGGELPPPGDMGGSGGATPTDIRMLKEQKKPANNQEMACVMAYYLQALAPQAERKTVVSGADIEKYFPQADYPLPKVATQVLIDAKAAGYFDAVERGTYKLNPVGHNLVVHSLPRKQGDGSPRVSKPRGAQRGGRKAKPKSKARGR